MQDLHDDEGDKNYNFRFTILNTDARSLSPKITSLIDCFDEMDDSVAVITETWLSDGVGLEEDVEQLQAGTDISTITLNRERNEQGFRDPN